MAALELTEKMNALTPDSIVKIYYIFEFMLWNVEYLVNGSVLR